MTLEPRILHLSTSDGLGGAARAAYRIHRAQVDLDLASSMLVLNRVESDALVKEVEPIGRIQGIKARVKRRLERELRRGWRTPNPVLHSLGFSSAFSRRTLKRLDADILNLHWVSGLLSISDIGRLTKPVVWTMHDMWAFCGAEHYASESPDSRWRHGYRGDNRPPSESGRDLNRLVWTRKRRAWKAPMVVVTPSRWLAGCVETSALFSEAQVHVVPNPIDLRSWRPRAMAEARADLGLPSEGVVVLFGAYGGLQDPRKGGDLLEAALARVQLEAKADFRLLIYGQAAPDESPEAKWNGWPVHYLGSVKDDHVLQSAYSAADVMVVPSRQDNLPNTAVEAQSCGTPVVAFNIGGLPDIVEHRSTGYLAEPFDSEDLAHGILSVTDSMEEPKAMRSAARNRAESLFDSRLVAARYREIYMSVVNTCSR